MKASETTGTANTIGGQLSFTASESYKLLRTNLMFALPSNKRCPVIAVTSAIRGEGKSTTASNLAYTLAETGAHVLLIDADMRLPSIARYFHLTGEAGLSKALVGLCTLKEALRPSGIRDNLYVMPVGTIPPNPSELLASSQMENLLEELSYGLEYIVIDLPPVNVVTDALVVSRLADAMLVTVRQGYSDKKAVQACMRQLELVDAKVAGFVFNDAGESGKHYGKYKYNSKYYKKYYKGYNYGYGYGYGEKPSKQKAAQETQPDQPNQSTQS